MTTQETGKKNGTSAGVAEEEMRSAKDLNAFLVRIQDRITAEEISPIYCLSAMNFVLDHKNIAELLDKENKELMRGIWLRLGQQGMQLRNPPLLFTQEEST